MLQQFDERNRDIQVFVGDRLWPREEAKISVFDSSVQGGDAVWEGIRVYKEGIFLFDRHLQRLKESAKAMAYEDVPDLEFIRSRVMATLHANQMREDVHIRLTLSRGEKITSGMDPRLNQSGPTLIVLAEWKAPVYDNERGISIVTSSIRRNSPNHVDSKIHHNNLINNILAKIQANVLVWMLPLCSTSTDLPANSMGQIFSWSGTKSFTHHTQTHVFMELPEH